MKPPSTDTLKTINYRVGILSCAKVRDYLQEKRLFARELEWSEGSGWFSRRWVIRCAVTTAIDIDNHFGQFKA